jgi:nicotinamidase-related amidase
MRTLFSILLVAFAFNLSLSSQSNPESSALILIDIQDFYFDTEKLPLEGNTEAAEVASTILKAFRENGGLIIHIRHKGGGEIHPLVKPEQEEIVIEKVHVNAFRDTDLLSVLKEHDTDNLVLAGMQTHMCLEAAPRAGDDYELLILHFL